MKRFGAIKPLERVVEAASLTNFHILVNSYDRLCSFPDQAVAVFAQDDGEFRKGDVVVKENGEWKRIKTLATKIGAVTRLRAMRKGNRVILRWSDPRDTFDKDGNLLSEFYRTILVRKFGSAPENEFDGTQIYINYKRNQYTGEDKPYFEDFIPVGDEIPLTFYRAFAVSKDGYVNRECEAVEAKELSWEEIRSMIKLSHGAKIFAPGDEIQLSDGNALVCTGLDVATPQYASSNPHTVSFILKNPYTHCPFDLAKGNYRLTADKIVNTKKTYYYFNNFNEYVQAPLRVGSVIPPGIYYESQTEVRGERGNNRWNFSDIRAWLNATSEANYSAAVVRLKSQLPDLPPPPLEYLTKELGEVFSQMVVQTKVLTGQPRCDGTVTESTIDSVFLPSITELTGNKNGIHKEGNFHTAFSEGRISTSIRNEVVALRSAKQDGTFVTDEGCQIAAVNNDGLIDYIDANDPSVAIRWMINIG